MPSFLKDLRRRSKASFRFDKAATNGVANDTSNGSSNAPKPAGNIPTTRSSSTLNSSPGSTPPSTLPSEASSSNLKTLLGNGNPPPVPPRPATNTNRYSSSGMTIMSSHTSNGLQKFAPTSPSAPRIFSISDNAWVHQRVLLIYGQAGGQKPQDGTLTVHHHQDNFPPISWPVCDSHFKALVHLQPGPNRLRFDFIASKSSSNSFTTHTSWMHVNYMPLNASPPVQLVILVAKDSPGTFDAVPERQQREGNGLETAKRKLRMAAYLWQAFTGEQMNRNGFGRRCFRYEEEWQPGTLTYHDLVTGQMRNEARIHVIQLNKTLAEIRDLDIAQQYEPAKRKGELFSIATDAIKAYFGIRNSSQKQYVSAMFLDTQWDKKVGTVRGHAALGGGDDGLSLAIFGSHALQSYPASLEEVVPAFTDCTRTDTKHVANDCNESGSNWEAANIGIGAHLHEMGHLLGCPHQESGIMLRDYTRLNRTFTVREPYSTRTRSQGQRICLQPDECAWHRLDCLRFRYHPCFRNPGEPPLPMDNSVQVWTVENGNIIIRAACGVAWIELFPEGDTECHSYIEYIEPSGHNAPRQLSTTDAELRASLPQEKRTKKLKAEIFSAGGGKHVIDDVSAMTSKSASIKIPGKRLGFRGGKVGFSQMEGSQPQDLILESAYIQTKLLRTIRVYHGFAVDGIEFYYEDDTSQLFGKRGGKPGGSEFVLDTRRGELLMGFNLRAGLWIDGIQIVTSMGRRSEWYGNAEGGSGHTLIPPRGYSIAGISGSCAQWLDGFSLIITR